MKKEAEEKLVKPANSDPAIKGIKFSGKKDAEGTDLAEPLSAEDVENLKAAMLVAECISEDITQLLGGTCIVSGLRSKTIKQMLTRIEKAYEDVFGDE